MYPFSLILIFLMLYLLYLHVCIHAARSKSMVLGELSRLSRPCSPLDQEKALKAGWLKRQRSIMKNWQLRWFVLRTEALYFYKDQDETKAQVTLTQIYTAHVYCTRQVHDVTCCPPVVWIHSGLKPETYSPRATPSDSENNFSALCDHDF